MTRNGPLVVCIPSFDQAFRAAVDAVLDETPGATPDAVEARVRAVYPAATIRARDLSDELVPTWYAYRDGQFHATPDWAWTDEPGTAWARIGADGVIEAENETLVELFGRPGESLVGRHVSDFIAPGAETISTRQFAAVLAATAEVRSVGRGRTADGATVDAEYVTRVTDGHVDAWFRRVALAGGRGTGGARSS